MENDSRLELRSYASQLWIGQWRLSTLDADGCLFVLRFLLRAVRSKGPEDSFWGFLARFLFAEEHRASAIDYECRVHPTEELVHYAETLSAQQARALVAFLSECYVAEGDRSFWSTDNEAVHLYTVAPYDGSPTGTA